MTNARFILGSSRTAFAFTLSTLVWACSSSTTDSPSDAEDATSETPDENDDEGTMEDKMSALGGSGSMGDGGDGDGDAPIDEVDEPVLPSVVATSPADGDDGVLPDARLTVTFSEPMDPESVEASYFSLTLPAKTVSFEWNKSFTKVTIIPEGLLDFEEGLELEPVAYDFEFSAKAKSEDGEALSDPVLVEFHTARRLEQTITAVPKLTGAIASNLEPIPYFVAGDTTTPTEVGMAYIVGACTFDLDELPADLVAFSEANFKAEQEVVMGGDPYGELGNLEFYDADYMDSTWDDIVGDLGSPFTARSNAAAAFVSVDVTEMVAADYANENFAQLAVRFVGTTNNDELMDAVGLTDPRLNIQFWVP